MQTIFTTVFVDILGFVSLVEANERSLDLLDSFYSSSKTLEEIRNWRLAILRHPDVGPFRGGIP